MAVAMPMSGAMLTLWQQIICTPSSAPMTTLRPVSLARRSTNGRAWVTTDAMMLGVQPNVCR